MKKIALIVALFLLMSQLIVPAQAMLHSQQINEFEDLQEQIDALFNQRGVLALDCGSNSCEIENIDAQLHDLGVIELSWSDVLEKYPLADNARVAIPEIEGVKWTENRTTIVYYGKMYDIQVLTAVLDVNNYANSPLRDFVSFTSSKQNFPAASVIGCTISIGASVMADVASDTLPGISTALALGESFYDMYAALDETINGPTTVVHNALCTFAITMITTMKYIFIKPQGTPDEGYQILGYVGNQTNSEIVCSYPSGEFEYVNGNYTEKILSHTRSGIIRSAGYDNSYMMAGKLMYEYRELGYHQNQLISNHTVRAMTIECLVDKYSGLAAAERNISVPILYIW